MMQSTEVAAAQVPGSLDGATTGEAVSAEGEPRRGPRGGRRPGAGRPATYREPLLRKTVTLPASYVAQLTWFGRGNLSDGIRLLAEEAYDRRGQPWLDLNSQDRAV